MSEEMNSAELIKVEISRYMELLKIERDMNGVTNNALIDALTESRVTLEMMGVNLEGLKIA